MEKFNQIFIIDDDSVNNLVASKIIERANIARKIKTFTNASFALDHLSANIVSKAALPQLIFLDINMPAMNGWEFLNAYQELPQSVRNKIKVYILSSTVFKEDIEKAESNEHVVDYLTKPLTVEAVNKIHATLLNDCDYSTMEA